MFTRILIPLDLSDKREAAVQAAAEIARKGKCEVILLHVIETIPGLDDEDVSDFYQKLQRKAQKHLEGLGRQLAGQRITWRSKVIVGNRAKAIVDSAAELGADLIAVTAPHISADSPAAGWASLSWKIAVLAPCAVLLVKEDSGGQPQVS